MATKKSGKKKGGKKSGKAKTAQRKSGSKKGGKKAAKKSSSRGTAAKRAGGKKKSSRRKPSLKTTTKSLISQTNRVLSGKANPVDVAGNLVEKAKEIVTEVLETARGAVVSAGEVGVETAQNIGVSVQRGAQSVLPRAAKVRRVR